MSFFKYLKDSFWTILYFIIIILIINLILLSSTALDKSTSDIIYMNILIFFISLMFLLVGYVKWRNTYKDIRKALCNIVVNDEEYEVLKLQFSEEQFNGIILDNPDDTKDITFDLAKVLPEDSGLFTYWIAGVTFYDFAGIVYFIGAFLSLVFVFATGSIIYFKTLSESFRDKNKYEILKKLGTTDLEIYSSVSKQVGIFFILPLIVGAIHSMVAISVLSDMMNYSLVVPTAISIGIFAIVYGIFYVFTTKKFITVVQ